MLNTIREINPELSYERARLITAEITQYSVANDVDPRIVAAIIAVESSFKEDAVGTSGEVGLMQLHPKFHRVSFNAVDNISTGARYLAGLKAVFGHRYPGLLWTEFYNRGPNTKPKQFPYAKKVAKFYARFGGENHGREEIRPVQLSKGRSKEPRRSISSTPRLHSRREWE